MKNTIVTVLTLAATFACGSLVAAPDIFDVRPCTAFGTEVTSDLPLYGTGVDGDKEPMDTGKKAYFKIRFLAKYDAEGAQYLSGHWDFYHEGFDWSMIGSTNLVYQPQIGIWVSGEVRFADYLGRIEKDEFFTDLVFEYETKPGDFALPIRLAALNADGDVVLASDTREKISSYFLNPMRKDEWVLRFPKPGESDKSKWYEAEWAVMQGVPGPGPSSSGRLEDLTLEQSGYYVKGLDFSSQWMTNKTEALSPKDVVWREVHQNSTTVEGGRVVLEALSAPVGRVEMHVWSTNEAAVVVKGGKPVLMADPQNPSGPKKTYQVATVIFDPGQRESRVFQIQGVSQTAAGGWSHLVLSAFDHFNVSDTTGDVAGDFITVPVRCIGPLPPNIQVTGPTLPVKVGPDYMVPATELKVTLSDTDFPLYTSCKVTVTPKLRNAPAGADWGDYVHISDGKDTGNEWMTEGPLELTFTKGGTLEKTVYVYALGADNLTADLDKGVEFEVSVEPEGYYEKLGKALVYLEPTKPVVTAGDAAVETIAGQARTFDLNVADCYKNLVDTNTCYELWYRQNDGAPKQIAGKWQPSSEGLLYLYDDEEGKLTRTPPSITFTVTGEYDIRFFVKAPNAQESVITAESTVHVTVKEAARMYALFQPQPVTNGVSWVESFTYKEGYVDEEGDYDDNGNQVYVKVVLTQPNESTQPVYAFLAPLFDTTNSVAGTILTNTPAATGMMIMSGESESDVGSFYITDGVSGGTPLRFAVVLSQSQTWDGKPLDTYQSKTMTVMSMNVKPTLESVKMDGAAKFSVNGGTIPTKVPVGVQKSFTVQFTEIGKVDREKFTVVWSVDEANGAHSGNEPTGDDPDPTVDLGADGKFKFDYRFRSKGLAHFEISYRDKDSKSSTFAFDVEVDNQPQILLDAGEAENVDETDMGGPSNFPIVLRFSDGGATLPLPEVETITAKVTVASLSTKTTDIRELGYLLLGGGNLLPYVENGVTNANAYLATFHSGAPEVRMYVAEADGTKISASAGIQLTAEVLNETTNTVSKSPWKDYYQKGYLTVYPQNLNPQVVVSPTDQSVSTNMIPANIGENVNIDYELSDITADLTNGITVILRATDLSTVTTNIFDVSNHTFSLKWMSSGQKDVYMTVYDKEKISPYVEFHWIYEVAPAKILLTVAHGPNGDGLGTPESVHYNKAQGLGEGYLFLDRRLSPVSFAAASGFTMTWKCSKVSNSAIVLGSGYKTNAVDNGWLVGGVSNATERYQYDIPVDRNGGNAIEGGEADLGSYYTYTGKVAGDPVARDSFLYAWIVKVVGDDGASGDTAEAPVTIAPERPLMGNGMSSKTISLPTQAGKDVGKGATETYAETHVEGVFSREWHPGDNMGDINWDGVPDLYVTTFNLPEGGESDSEGSTDMPDDLTDLNDLKYVIDWLPTTDLVPYAKVMNMSTEEVKKLGLLNPFTSKLKIRGYGDGLNDATAGSLPNNDGTWTVNPCAISGVQPDRVYTNPKLDKYSTLSYVEWLAWSEFAAAHYGADAVTNAAYFAKWSPERPTDPTKTDTDDDGMPDGYEYYFWYRAHVGWVENEDLPDECHRYLTGRRYDPRNPGEGTLITSAEIERAMDPLAASGSLEQDTDNDGLPDILEIMYLGTDPFDFDSDGDGLPDGWELSYTSNLDPTDPSSLSDGKSDAERNYDGDAMAFTTVALEENVLPKPRFIQRYNTFATVDADGDTDGIQWYAETPLDGGVSAFAFAFDEAATSGTVFRIGGVDYVTTRPFAVTADNRLAVTLTTDTYVVTNAAEAATALALEAPEGVKYVRLRPVKLTAGPVVETNEANVAFAVARVAANAAPEKCNAAWTYGNANVLGGKFGMLALARYQLPKEGDAVAELPTAKRDVAYLHYLVYQQFGFDPRTAWNENTPLAARWGKTGDVDSSAGQVSKKGYADQSTRTRAYTAYDEFLLYSFFLNNGCDMGGYIAKSATAKEIINLWGAFTTNPQGPNEPAPKVGTRADVADVEYLARGTNGADTDDDGVPDGWELYIMAGPKIGKDGKADPKDGKFNFAPAYTAFTAAGEEVIEMPQSYFSPFVKAATIGTTDNMAYIGKDQNDSLNEYQEFAGTDSCGYYEKVQSGNTVPYSTTVKLPEGWTWLNKFFPTDPWVPDTDDDGVKDNEEGGAFAYAKDAVPEDDGTSICFAGCGLNPCSVDTDGDGIPDGWEKQFAGSTVSTNAVEGYIDGMDGTVKDAVTVPRKGPNRDYDHDGLENWQEYLTGTMRCWRYDDPFTQWGAIPFYAYYFVNSDNGNVNFSPKFDVLFGYFPEEERPALRKMNEEECWNWFWYQTLVNIGGPIYNPHLVTDQSPTAQYFSRVDVGWDPNYWDSVLAGTDDPDKGVCGRYYWFAHRIGRTKYKEAWTKFYGSDYAPTLYVSCSPRSEDSDHDGMDDFYELFHGLNPLLGGDGMTAFEDPADIVKCIKGADRSGPVSFNYNPWVSPWQVGLMMQPPMRPAREVCDNPDFDFIVHPWKNGLQTADPDGDNERNYVEAILAKTVFGMHTDPSPAWMTDASYADSLTRLCYRVPRVNYFIPFKFGMVNDQVKDQNGDSVPGFTYRDVKYYFRDFDAYDMKSEGKSLEFFSPDAWSVSGDLLDARTPEYLLTSDRVTLGGWMFSFEENEGYDTDHDAMGDEEEIAGRIRSATDPLDFDSPRRRQAMYFPGKDSALQTPPEMIEEHPIVGSWYKQDPSFAHYTVECWVRPEEIRNATVVERAIWSDGSNGGDANLVRKNFLIGTRVGEDGKCYWFTKFDSNGTGSEKKDEVSVRSGTPAEIGVWTHVAATYDGEHIVLYVNGQQSGTPADPWRTKPLPECAVAEVLTYRAQPVAGQLETIARYSHHAIVVGASVKSYDDYDADFTDQVCGYAVNLYNAMGWSYYKDFFKGYVDEIRIWDGARKQEEIQGSMRTRFDSEKAKENRSATYKALNLRNWAGRYEKGEDGTVEEMPAELRYHFSFDALPSAANAEYLAVAPQGFANGDKAPVSRPEGYEIAWWKRILDSYGSAYAGAANFVNWIPNTVAHLPRFDGTTYDSAFWSDDYKGDLAEVNRFAHTAEPYPLWKQVLIGRYTGDLCSTLSRWYLANVAGTNSDLSAMFDFTGRHLLCEGADLLPLGGAYARYVDTMWDGQGASSMRELTGEDNDNDGLPDWWQVYANQNYHRDVPEEEDITWDTLVWYEVGGVEIRITAAEAYKRDLAKGAYVDESGVVHPTADERAAQTVLPYVQTAKSDSMIPDWWKELKKIDSEEPLADLDRDGLNNYVEYVASELLPFQLNLDPRMAFSDSKTLDYFRKVGRLYLGEMLTDHDQMEDHWERSLGDENVASAAIWDALRDGEEDGWTNFAENRYNGYSMSTLAQLVAHAMGDNEVLDAPTPSIKMKVRYNGGRPLAEASSDGGNGSKGTSDAVPSLVVRAYSKNAETGDYAMNPDATWTVTPGVETEERSFYLGAWEDRIVRGTLAPGNVNLDSVDIKFAQVPQNDLYSWSDESGLHLAKSYKEFKEAFDKNPNIIQNIQSFQWLSLVAPVNEYTSSDKAVTVGRDNQSQQNAPIAVYGEPVGSIDLTTGDFEFDLGAMNKLRVNYTFDGAKGSAAAWSYKEAIFKITYTAKVPSSQQKVVDFSLAKADKGFVRGGLNSIEVFYDSVNANGTWDPGEPFGVVNDVEIGWAGRDVEIDLTDMSAVTPRVKLWGESGGEGGNAGGGNAGGEAEGVTASAADSDRGMRVGTDWTTELPITMELMGKDASGRPLPRRVATNAYDRLNRLAAAPGEKVNVKVVRYTVDNFMAYRAGAPSTVIMEKTFEHTSRDFLHEGDFLADGELDIDWSTLSNEVVTVSGVQSAGCEVTNVTYLVVFNWGPTAFRTDSDTNTVVSAFSTLVTRRFEVERTVPTPVQANSTVTVFNKSRPTFTWRIDGEDTWASWFGTTYTAFKVRVKDLTGKLVYDSGVRRLPAKDSEGQYSWTAPLYVGEVVPGTGVLFANLTDYTWEVAVYNAKFSTDDLMAMKTKGNPFSSPKTFRMNVTGQDASSCALAVRACYVGPATWLEGRIHVQAFESPDFTGDPVAAVTLGDVSEEALSPSSKTANAKLIGLPEGKYFLRAYIDTNGNGVHDDWESWGYLNERDLASKPGIFNPVAAEATLNPDEANVRTVLIEDCDTDGDWFPDVWEAEQNGGVFDPEVVKPVTGDAELIGVNPELKSVLNANEEASAPVMRNVMMALRSPAGVSLMTGIDPADVEVTDGGLEVKSEVDPETLTIVGFAVDAAQNRVLLKVGAETTANVDAVVANFLNITVRKGAEVTVRVERAESPNGPWTELEGVDGTVTVDRAGADIEVKLNGELPAQGYFRAKVEE